MHSQQVSAHSLDRVRQFLEAGQGDAAESELGVKFAQEESLCIGLLLAARVAVRRFDHNAAFLRFAALASIVPENREAVMGACDALLALGRNDEAADFMLAATKRNPTDVDLLSRAAKILAGAGRGEEALAAWGQLRHDHPQHILGYVDAAEFLQRQGRLDEARSLCEQAREQLPDNYWGYHYLGVIEEAAGKGEAALSVWREACRCFPRSMLPYFQQGLQLLHLGRADEATGLLEQAHEFEPHAIEPLFALAAAHRQLQDFDRAIDAWRRLRSIANRPQQRFIHVTLDLWRTFKDHPGAADFLIEALDEQPDGSPNWSPQIISRMAPGGIGDATPESAVYRDGLRAVLAGADLSHLANETRLPLRSFLGHGATSEDLLQGFRQQMARPNLDPAALLPFANAFSPLTVPAAMMVEVLNQYTDELAADLLAKPAECSRRERELYTLIALGDTIDPQARQRAADLTVAAQRSATPSSAWGRSLAGVASAWAERTALPAPALARHPARIKLVIEVSGQLRGYRGALASWQALALDTVDTHYVVHTWANIGRKSAHDEIGARRSLGGAFGSTFADALSSLGTEHMFARYPRLRMILGASTPVRPEDVRQFYGTNDVVIEDEALPKFAQKPNPWKMYYKVHAAHQLAREKHPDAHMFMRIRPDQLIRSANAPNWQDLYARSEQGSILFADAPRVLLPGFGMMMGDQAAFGARGCMDAYASALTDTEDAAAGLLMGYPDLPQPHMNFAYSTFIRGISTEHPPGIEYGDLVNASLIPPEELRSALLNDVNSRPNDGLDDKLLAALRADLNEGDAPS